MKTSDGVAFLQWALPRLGFRWPGFRKVRRQVLKRLRRRIGELALTDLDAYRARLDSDPAEWTVLDAFYFDPAGQRRMLARLAGRLRDGDALVVGVHESLPVGEAGFAPWPCRRCLYRRQTAR